MVKWRWSQPVDATSSKPGGGAREVAYESRIISAGEGRALAALESGRDDSRHCPDDGQGRDGALPGGVGTWRVCSAAAVPLATGPDTAGARGDLAWTVRPALDPPNCSGSWPIALEREPRDCPQRRAVVAVPSSSSRSTCLGPSAQA